MLLGFRDHPPRGCPAAFQAAGPRRRSTGRPPRRLPDDLGVLPLLDVELVPVVAPSHPLARLGRPVSRTDLEAHTQLVLSDPFEQEGASYGVVSPRVWRFVELARRADFLRAGLGWCRMPTPLVGSALSDGRLVRREIADEADRPPAKVTIYAAHLPDRPPGLAGGFLLDHLRASLA